MPYYAHAVIEDGSKKYQPGDLVPDSISGLDELLEHGSVSVEQFTREVTVDAKGRVIGDAHVEAFAGDFTGDEIDDPDTPTPSLGRPGDPEQVDHAARHDSGESNA